jgi:hypothetical protein
MNGTPLAIDKLIITTLESYLIEQKKQTFQSNIKVIRKQYTVVDFRVISWSEKKVRTVEISGF